MSGGLTPPISTVVDPATELGVVPGITAGVVGVIVAFVVLLSPAGPTTNGGVAWRKG